MVDVSSVFRELVQFEIELWDAVDSRLRAECDLQLTWYEVMAALGRRRACRVQDLAQEFSITVGGTSKVVDRVEAAGYCRRRANPDDRRSSLIELTPAGRRLTTKATKIYEAELQTRIGSVLTPHALQQLATTITKLRTAPRPA